MVCPDDLPEGLERGFAHPEHFVPSEGQRIPLPGPYHDTREERLFLLARPDAGTAGFRAKTGDWSWEFATFDAPFAPDSWQWMVAKGPVGGPGPLSFDSPGKIAVDRASGRCVIRRDHSLPGRRRMVHLETVAQQEPCVSKSLRDLVPKGIIRPEGSTIDNAARLSQWVAWQWNYRNTLNGRTYASWHTPTILEWGRRGTDPAGRPVIAMCVHYSVVFHQIAAAFQIQSRLVVLSPGLNLPSGHFVCEVWVPEESRWALFDPNLALGFHTPSRARLSALEVAQLADPAASAQFELPELWNAHNAAFAVDPSTFAHVGIWRPCDFFAFPENAPPGHGMLPYSETDILWVVDPPRFSPPPPFPFGVSPGEIRQPPHW